MGITITTEVTIVKVMNKINKFFNRNIKYSFLLPIFLKEALPNPIDNNSDPFIQYLYSVTTLQIFIFIGFINILTYILVIYLIKYYNIEDKYPKYIKYINYVKNSNLAVILFEVVLVLILQIILMGLNIYILWKL